MLTLEPSLQLPAHLFVENLSLVHASKEKDGVLPYLVKRALWFASFNMTFGFSLFRRLFNVALRLVGALENGYLEAQLDIKKV